MTNIILNEHEVIEENVDESEFNSSRKSSEIESHDSVILSPVGSGETSYQHSHRSSSRKVPSANKA